MDEPLVYFNGSSSVVLQTILKSVCDLLSFQEMLSRVDNSSDMYLLLTQNTVDSCAWVSCIPKFIHQIGTFESFLQTLYSDTSTAQQSCH